MVRKFIMSNKYSTNTI